MGCGQLVCFFDINCDSGKKKCCSGCCKNKCCCKDKDNKSSSKNDPGKDENSKIEYLEEKINVMFGGCATVSHVDGKIFVTIGKLKLEIVNTVDELFQLIYVDANNDASLKSLGKLVEANPDRFLFNILSFESHIPNVCYIFGEKQIDAAKLFRTLTQRFVEGEIYMRVTQYIIQYIGDKKCKGDYYINLKNGVMYILEENNLLSIAASYDLDFDVYPEPFYDVKYKKFCRREVFEGCDQSLAEKEFNEGHYTKEVIERLKLVPTENEIDD